MLSVRPERRRECPGVLKMFLNRRNLAGRPFFDPGFIAARDLPLIQRQILLMIFDYSGDVCLIEGGAREFRKLVHLSLMFFIEIGGDRQIFHGS